MSRIEAAEPAVPPPTGTAGGFRPDIEGLRAVAVLAVVLFHAGVPGLGGGFVGVDVFFVISGYLITGMLWRETSATGTVRLRRFYGARARRLLPASALVGSVTLIAALLLLPPLQLKVVSIDAITSALYVSNYWFASMGVNYFGKDNLMSPSPFQHYWSLGVEEQFYLLWPVLILAAAWVVRRIRRGAAQPGHRPSVRPYVVVLGVVAAGSFGLSLVVTYVMPPVAYFSLPTRAWQLSVGGLVALTAHQWRRLPAAAAVPLGWTGLGLVLLAYLGIDQTTRYPGVAALLPTLGAALVLGAGVGAGARGCGRVLGTAPMRAVGRVSYSWYLWHWPVLVLLPVALGHRLGVAGTLFAVLGSLGLAVLTLRYVENPIRFAGRLRRSPGASLALGGAVTAVAVVVGSLPLVAVPAQVGRGPDGPALRFTAVGVPPGSPPDAYDAAVRDVVGQVQAAVVASLGITAVPANLTPALSDLVEQFSAMAKGGCLRVAPFDSSQPRCVVGDPDSATRVALIGDSHAAMFNPAFTYEAERRGWRLTLMSKVACPIVDLPLTPRFNALAELYQGCAAWRARITARLRAERPDLVVISTVRAYGADGTGIWKEPGFRPFDEGWLAGLGDLVRDLRAQGAQVLVLGPTPGPVQAVPICLSEHLDDAAACAVAQSTLGDPAGIAAERAAVVANGGHHADLAPLFCARDRCPVIVGNVLVQYDAGHLTREYSVAIAPALGAMAERTLAAAPPLPGTRAGQR